MKIEKLRYSIHFQYSIICVPGNGLRNQAEYVRHGPKSQLKK